jgi:DNA primase
MISPEDKERVREATDILSLVSETVVLKPRGMDDYWGCCPFHQEKSPSFHVRTGVGLWHCFGCGTGGDVFDYVMKRENLEFADAIRYLADRAGIELHETQERGRDAGPRKNRLFGVLKEAEDFFHMQLMRVPDAPQAAARSYFASRSMGSPVCKKWGLGYAPGYGRLVAHLTNKGYSRQEILAADLAVERNGRLQDRFYNRVMFPIHDEMGKTIGFGGRVMGDDKPKYLNSKDTPVWHKSKHLFAFDQAKDSIVAKGEVIVVEGYTDAITLHEHGFTNVVAVLGTALTPDHIKLLNRLKPKRIVSMLDGDAPGQAAAEKAVRYIDQTPANLMCVVLPDNNDPAEYLAAHSEAELAERIAEARPLVDFVIDRRFESIDLSNPGQRIAALKDIAPVVAPLAGTVVIDEYAAKIADALHLERDQVIKAIRQAKPAESEPYADPAPNYTFAEPEPYAPAPPNPCDGMGVLTADEREQIRVERELLGLMARKPDLVRPYADRIGTFSWTDDRHLSIAWAILATPEGASGTECVARASEACPQAPQILSMSTLDAAHEMDDDEAVPFLLNTIELFSTKRKISAIKARLASTTDSATMRGLFEEATELQKHVNMLSACIAKGESSL